MSLQALRGRGIPEGISPPPSPTAGTAAVGLGGTAIGAARPGSPEAAPPLRRAPMGADEVAPVLARFEVGPCGFRAAFDSGTFDC